MKDRDAFQRLRQTLSTDAPDELARRDVLSQALVFAEELKGLYELEKKRADQLELAKKALEIAAEKTREAERLREEFVANCSHELRTPLTPIIGWASHLSTKDVSEEDVKQFAGTIHRKAKHLLKVVDSLLRVATIQRSGERSLSLDRVEISRAFERITTTRESERVFEVKVAPEASSLVTEPVYFQEIVSHLIDNALKFSPPASPIQLEALRVDQEAKFSVVDRGPGVPASKREDVFSAFTQGNGGSTREHGGLGVGLYICRELVDALGGRIWVDETPGGGATFCFALPQRRTTDAAA